MIDASSGAPVRLPQELRESLQRFAGEPLEFRG
jgi:acyl-CoA thioesterase FadM